ncbi:MAG: hypothetical protein NTW29_05200 [Bacteroidetes bacterium]|nr:hypothetical protein [Bacteroidota bacterium]
MMKNTFLPFLFFVLFLASCKNNDKTVAKSENKVDAARNFIRAALDGKFREAASFMLQDSVNMNWLDVAERNYQKADQTVKDGYRAASIRFPGDMADVNDSTSIIIFSNSYKNDPDTLRLVRINNNWLVDLKYLYQHDADTTPLKTITMDSLQ